MLISPFKLNLVQMSPNLRANHAALLVGKHRDATRVRRRPACLVYVYLWRVAAHIYGL